ncbi:MAG: radical SAM protein [Marinisporobacter sp.]|jgi:radical SAM protein with 4Fe4S-binding SPASM domain|nr:radical SAM protein [Marinisporobacter sp.]
MYYKLYPENTIVYGKKGFCIHSIINSKMYHFESKYIPIIKDIERNKPLEDIYNKYDEKTVKDLTQFLNEKVLGKFHKKNIFIERLRTYTKNNYLLEKYYNDFEISSVWIELNGNCNYNCSFCNEENHVLKSCGCKKWPDQRNLTLNDYYKLIDKLIDWKCKEYVFMGGEPLLNIETLEGILNYFNKKNYSPNITIYTNALLLTDELINNFKHFNIKYVITLFSHNEKTYDLITKINGSYRKVVNTITKLKQQKIAYTLQGLISPYNQHELPDFIEYLKNHNYTLNYIYDTVNNYDYYEEINKIENKLISSDYLDEAKHYNFCFYKKIAISNTGDIFPCPMIRYSSLGNIKKQSLVDIIKEKKIFEFWELTKDKIEDCKNCEYRYACLDCRALEYAQSGSLYKTNFCEYAGENNK